MSMYALRAIGVGKPGWDRGAIAVKARADQRAARILPIIEAIRAEGITSKSGIAKALNRRGVLTARGRTWDATRVRLLLARRLP
jgi:hypothetical protein